MYVCMYVCREGVSFNIYVQLQLINHDADIAAIVYGFRFLGWQMLI